MIFEMTKPHCRYFYEISKIPHGSKNEKAISNYLVDFAKSRNLKYMQDELWNVIIYKGASEGYKSSQPLMLQAHTDMVCEKNKSSDHDFENDAIEFVVNDGILKANGTTLGADDGTGVAYMLAILDDDSLVHPPLECVFTTQEEIGMFGAMVLKKEDINSRRMISLDGGSETATMLSSAGGCRCSISKDVVFVPNSDKCYRLMIRGLSGGHSGGEIHKEKGNSNKLASRILKEAIFNNIDILLVSIDGGLKENAIPRECEIVFSSSAGYELLYNSFNSSAKDISNELAFSDENFMIEIEEVDMVNECMSISDSMDIINFIYLVPNGFKARSMAIEGLTLTSLNLGVVKTTDSKVICNFTIRSAIESAIDDLVNQVVSVSKLFGFSCDVGARYPAWNYSPVSKMREVMGECVKEIYNTELELKATHGGLECGVFTAMHSDMDIIMMGPIAKHIHTPDEQLDLASFDRAYKLLCAIVTRCASK